MIHDLLSLEAYFAAYKGRFGIEDFCYGSTDDILNRKSKIIRYPCLWVELLEERTDANDNVLFDIRLTLEQNAGNNPRSEDRIKLNNLRRMLRNILDKMRNDSPNVLVYHTYAARFFYKEQFANDNELLAQVELTIGGIHICTD